MLDNLFNLFEEDDNLNEKRSWAKATHHDTGRVFDPTLGMGGKELESLMGQVADVCEATGDGDIYPAMVPFYKSLIHSVVLVPSLFSGADSSACRLLTIQNPDGDRGIAVFTTEESLQNWITEPTEYFAVPFRVICAKVLEQGLDFVVINDAGPARGELSAYELSYLAEGLVPPYSGINDEGVVLDESTEIALGIPMVPPSEMFIERILGCFDQNRQWVESAYVFQISISQGPPHLAVGIRMVPGQERYWETGLLPDTMAISREVLERNEYMDFFLLNEAQELERSLMEFTQPFYEGQRAS